MSISWAAFGGSPHDEHSLGSALPLETRQASMISTKWTALGHCDKMPTLWTSTGKLWQVTTSIMSISWESFGREKPTGQHHVRNPNTTGQHHEHQLGVFLALPASSAKMPALWTSTGQVTSSIMSISWESFGREKQARQHHEHQPSGFLAPPAS